MAITCPSLAQSLLDWIDVPSVAVASASQQRALVDTINGSLQEIFTKGPAHFRRRQLSTILNGPTTVTLDVTNGSTAVTFVAGWQSWMTGCTIRITNDNGGALAAGTVVDNEVVSATEIVQPYQGPSASAIVAQVFGDCIDCDPTVSQIMGDPRLAGIRQLIAAPDREAFNKASWFYEGDYGEMVLQVQARPKWIGQPHTYWIDAAWDPATGATQPQIRLRVTPLPIGPYVLNFDAMLNAPAITSADLTNSATVFQLPGSRGEMILQAFCAQRWTGSPWFKNAGAAKEIARQYDEAVGALYGTRPQNRRNRRIVPIR